MQVKNYLSNNGQYYANEGSNSISKLPSGSYQLKMNEMTGQFYFEEKKMNYDQLIDLPSSEYDQVMQEIDTFLKPNTKSKFADMGFLYKRSALLYGLPGAGKTCIVNRVSEKVIAKQGIVLINPHPGLLGPAFSALDSTQPDTLVMVVFEELDKLSEHFENELLNLLDGEVQKNNVVYVATTNFIDRVPTRLLRPGRFSSVIEVGFPNDAAREKYLSLKLPSEADLGDWVAATDGLSIDELKEAVLATFCLDQSREEVLARIRSIKQSNRNYKDYESDRDSTIFREEMRKINRAVKVQLERPSWGDM